MTKDELKELCQSATVYIAHNRYMRMGQALFNTLRELHPEIADDVRDSSNNCDPFYDDSKIPAFFNFIY